MKNCSNCSYYLKNKCENSDWKTGKEIVDPSKPECGYLTKTSKTPIGFKNAKDVVA